MLDLPRSGNTRLTLVDPLGREVATIVDGPMERGRHQVVIATGSLPTGRYFLKLVAGDSIETLPLVITR